VDLFLEASSQESLCFKDNGFIFQNSGGPRGGVGGAGGAGRALGPFPPLFWVKQNKTAEGRKGARQAKITSPTPPPPLLPSSRSGSDVGEWCCVQKVNGVAYKYIKRYGKIF